MSLIIKNTRMPLVTSTLPPLQDRLAALRISGLQGLYMFEDGTPGQPYTTALDVSGNGKNAIARTSGGFVTPLAESYGVLIPAGADTTHCNGLFDTTIPRTDTSSGFTQLMASANLSPAVSGESYYAGLTGIGANIAQNGIGGTPGLGLNVRTLFSGSPLEYHGSIDMTGGFLGLYQEVSDGRLGPGGPATIMETLRLDVGAGTISYDYAGINGTKVTPASHQALKSGWSASGAVGNQSFGVFPQYVLSGAKINTIKMYAVAFYSRPLTDAEVTAAFANLATVFSKRGITT